MENGKWKWAVEGAVEAARQLQGGSLEMRNSKIQNRILYLILC